MVEGWFSRFFLHFQRLKVATILHCSNHFCVLRSGWLCITCRSVFFQGDVIRWLYFRVTTHTVNCTFTTFHIDSHVVQQLTGTYGIVILQEIWEYLRKISGKAQLQSAMSQAYLVSKWNLNLIGHLSINCANLDKDSGKQSGTRPYLHHKKFSHLIPQPDPLPTSCGSL